MNVLDQVEVESLIKKLEFYSLEEKNIISVIREIFRDTSLNYSDSNDSKTYDKKSELLINYNTINKITDNYILVLTKNKEKYLETARKAEDTLDLVG